MEAKFIVLMHLLLSTVLCVKSEKIHHSDGEHENVQTSNDRFYPDEIECRKGLSVAVNNLTYYVIKDSVNFRRGQLCWVKDARTEIVRILKIMDKHSFWPEIVNEHHFNLLLEHFHHMPKFIDWEERPHVFLAVMEYTKNTMKTYPWSSRYIREFFRKMVTAVAALHEHGVINLGINRPNILLDDDSVVKFLDFGLAAEMNDLQQSSFAKQQFPLTTTAPEVFSKQRLDEMGANVSACTLHNNLTIPVLEEEGFKIKAFNDFSKDCRAAPQVGPASDLWSICCVVFEMMYGDSPFEHLIRRLHSWYSIPQRMVEHLLLAMIVDHSQEVYFPPYADLQLRSIVGKCLKRGPNSRPSASELIQMLSGKTEEL